MEIRPQIEIRELRLNSFERKRLDNNIMDILFGTEKEKASEILKNTYLVFNEKIEEWQTVPKTEIDRNNHTRVDQIHGIICADNDIYLVTRWEKFPDIQKNRELVYLRKWPESVIPPKKYQRAIKI